MQYILTEQEYHDLLFKKRERIRLDTENLQALCTKIANEMPVERHWAPDDKSPWGCLLTRDRRSHYCDNCPVKDICPYENKDFSK